jgi:hypothetical protein
MVAMLCDADGCQSKVPYGSVPKEATDEHRVTPGAVRVKRKPEDFGRKRGRRGSRTKVVNSGQAGGRLCAMACGWGLYSVRNDKA